MARAVGPEKILSRAFYRTTLEVRFINANLHNPPPSRLAFVCTHLPLSRLFCLHHLQAGSSPCIKLNSGADKAVSGHNFIQGARAKPSENICDFAEYAPDGDLHKQSSHAHAKPQINLLFILKERLA